ncbi:MAG: Hsp20/alpha crystallin family protein [Saprospiraceae bacterium]
MANLSKWSDPAFKANALFPTFSNMVDNFFGKDFESIFDTMSKGIMVPAVNVIENKDNYMVEVAAPGLKKEDFKIEVKDNMLSISSEKEVEKDKSTKKYTRKEYSFSSFARTFYLPDDVDVNSINANYENGELSIKINRKEVKVENKKEIKVN